MFPFFLLSLPITVRSVSEEYYVIVKTTFLAMIFDQPILISSFFISDSKSVIAKFKEIEEEKKETSHMSSHKPKIYISECSCL